MKTLNRLLLLALAGTLLATAYASHSGTNEVTLGHESFAYVKRPWLHEAHEVSLYGVLIWCVLFVRSQPAFVRIGLVAVILGVAILTLPPKVFKEPITLPGTHESWH